MRKTHSKSIPRIKILRIDRCLPSNSRSCAKKVSHQFFLMVFPALRHMKFSLKPVDRNLDIVIWNVESFELLMSALKSFAENFRVQLPSSSRESNPHFSSHPAQNHRNQSETLSHIPCSLSNFHHQDNFQLQHRPRGH